MRTVPSKTAIRAIAIAAYTAVALLPLLFRCDARAQGVDSTRVITIPAPDQGVIYIRSGRPGGVRIRSRHTTRPAVAARPIRSDIQQDLDASSAAFRPADLARLEALLARQDLDLDLGLGRRRGGEDVVVLRRRGDGQVADTLSFTEATSLLRSLGGPATPAEAARADMPPLVTRVERSLLEAGLFRSLQINFEFDRSELLGTAGPTLDAVADVLERFRALQIEVAGHTDSIGPDAYNRRLSDTRAEEVRRTLIERGIAPERIRARGYGEARPVLSNATPTGRALNRRVEFVLLNPEAADQYRPETRQDPQEQLERLRESIQDGIRDGFDETREDNN